MIGYIVAAVLAVVILAFLGYKLGVWLFCKDEEIEDRRRYAAKMATILSKLGLKKIPDFLIDYSVGDYSEMHEHMKESVRLFLSSEQAVLDEFAQVFDNCLVARLATEEGRAYIAAKLVDATKEDDVSAIKAAPKPGVV
jgi:hypothetical protein